MNFVRCEMKDEDTAKDWLRPFVKSMLIWEEDGYRREIGLPSLLPDGLDGLRHSTFMNMVTNGHQNPFYEWEKEWKDRLPYWSETQSVSQETDDIGSRVLCVDGSCIGTIGVNGRCKICGKAHLDL